MKGELVKAEDLLTQARVQLQRLSALFEERKQELLETEAQIKAAAAAGNADKVMALQSRLSALDKSISELGVSQAECARRVESIEEYLNILRSRLRRLREEAESLTAAGEQMRLARIKVQIEAITGRKE
ncbi:MAG TPA: hypothetical protein VNO70_22550 [Blastocatellia bacterium]|nr:hypothetical protein [Blastocatellia bacterium]